jgi:hypothetical protein
MLYYAGWGLHTCMNFQTTRSARKTQMTAKKHSIPFQRPNSACLRSLYLHDCYSDILGRTDGAFKPWHVDIVLSSDPLVIPTMRLLLQQKPPERLLQTDDHFPTSIPCRRTESPVLIYQTHNTFARCETRSTRLTVLQVGS